LSAANAIHWEGTAADLAAAIKEAGSMNALGRERGHSPHVVRRWVADFGIQVVQQRKPRVDLLDLVPASEPWAGPRALLVKPSTKASDEVVVTISDIHSPFHDETAVESALMLIREIKPDTIVINGDLPDYFGISSHNRTLERLDSLQAEIDQANALRRAIRAAAPDAVIHENEGNHDSRLRTFVRQQAPQLRSLRALDPANLNAWGELDIQPHGVAGFRIRPEFVIRHGTYIRSDAGASARAEMKAAKISGQSGHTHRLAEAVEHGYRVRSWSESGCLCQLSPDYVDGPPNWDHGLLVGYFSTKTDAFLVDSVKATNGVFRYGGRRFDPLPTHPA
jgi:hypothetical protein